MIRRQLGFSLLGTVLLLACGSDPEDANGDGVADGILEPNNVSVITPTNPRGYVAGKIVDGITGQPLAGAKVTMFGGGLAGELTTEGTGQFQFGPIAAGAKFSIDVSASGYTAASMGRLEIDDAAGNFPTDNGALWVGPIGLMPTTGAFSVQVVSESGAPVANARVQIESSVAYYDAGSARGSVVVGGTTNSDGQADVTGLPNVWALPPRLAGQAGLIINVSPVDLDGDMRPDLRGKAMAISGDEVRALTRPPVIVLESPDQNIALEVIASNLPGLVAPQGQNAPTVLDPTEPIRIAFNQPIEQESFFVSLTDETGDNQIATNVIAGVLGNTVEITHDTTFQIAQEHNIYLQARTRDAIPGTAVTKTASFFARGDPAEAIRVTGEFVDANEDNMWGNGRDRIDIRVSVPIGRPGRDPAFVSHLYVDLDLNGSMVTGDSTGELPAAGELRPNPIVLNAAEPTPKNGAGKSGYTRYVTSLMLNIEPPRAQLQGPVEFEISFPMEANGAVVTDPGGRAILNRIVGSARLTQP